MTYQIKVHLTLEAETPVQALAQAAAVVGNTDPDTGLWTIQGVGLARGYVAVEAVRVPK